MYFYASSAASAQIYATAERIFSRASDLCRAFPFFTLHLERLLRHGDNVSGEKAYPGIPGSVLILHVLLHHCQVVVILAEAVTLIERDGPRIGRDDLDMEKVGEVFHDALHEFVADVSALVLWVNQNVVQECDGGAVIKGTHQADQPVPIPERNDVR